MQLRVTLLALLLSFYSCFTCNEW